MMLQHHIMVLIQTYYTGGMDAYVAQDNQFRVLPCNPPVILFYTPGDTNGDMSKVCEKLKEKGVNTYHVKSLGFEGVSPDDLKSHINGYLTEHTDVFKGVTLGVSGSPLCLEFVFLDPVDQEKLSSIALCLKGLPGMNVGVIVANNTCYLVEGDGQHALEPYAQTMADEKPTVICTPEKVERTAPIDDIDLGILHKNLEDSSTVEAFLATLGIGTGEGGSNDKRTTKSG